MLFVTNRAINEQLEFAPGRRVSFDHSNNQAGQALFFCRRLGPGEYVEVGHVNFLEELKASGYREVLVYIHGFNNQPETDVFPRAQTLQELLDAIPNLALVVPLLWPCSDKTGVIRDYYCDQDSADASSFAFSRLLEKFAVWQEANLSRDIPPCLKRINVLAHSMGNRVLRETLYRFAKNKRCGKMPLIFRNIFMAAPDLKNDTLEHGKSGSFITDSAKNVVVYFSADDLALRSSKVANGMVARRLGHTGPSNPQFAPANVYLADCDGVNTLYDYPLGHSYFMRAPDGEPGVVFKSMLHAISTGKIETTQNPRQVKLN